jgi:hypothetical protein
MPWLEAQENGFRKSYLIVLKRGQFTFILRLSYGKMCGFTFSTVKMASCSVTNRDSS